MKQLIEDAENKRFDVIVAKELSRLERNVELLYRLVRIASTQGVRVITLDGKVDTEDPAKQAMFGLYAWIYESESQRSSDRIKSVFRMKQKNGIFLGAIAPYGYRVENGKLYIREDETPNIVRTIFNQFLEGWTRNAIAKHLNEKGVPTPSQVSRQGATATYWSPIMIKKMLSNPHYVGDLAQNKTTTISVVNKKSKVNKEEDWIVVPNTHEPIVSRGTFAQAKEILQTQAEHGRGRTKPVASLFTNMIYCADCGKPLWYQKATKARKTSVYVCGSYGRHGKQLCTSHRIREQELCRVILSDLQKMGEQLNNAS